MSVGFILGFLFISVIAIIYILSRVELMKQIGVSWWKGLIPGLAERELALKLDYNDLLCWLIFASIILSGLLLAVGNIVTMILAGLVIVAYFVFFFRVADDLAYYAKQPSWFMFIILLFPFVAFPLMAFVPKFKLVIPN